MKKWIIIETAILLVTVLMFAQATYAYFSDQSRTAVVITSGSVKIQLSEAAVKRDANGNLIEDTSKPRIFGTTDGIVHDYGIVYPGQKILKDPTILNTGTNDAYIAAKVTITDGRGDIHRVIGYEDYPHIDLSMLFSGGLLSETAHFGVWNGIDNVTYNENMAYVQVPHRAEGRYDIYFFILKPLKYGESVMLFDEIAFSPYFTGEEMEEFVELRVDIVGFGVQSFGFDSCLAALTGALPGPFGDFLQSTP